MSAWIKEIEARALGLSAVERASLAEKLLSSLDSHHQASFDQEWAVEGEDRIRAFERGEMGASETSIVFERLEKKYGK